jgi:hypothetical protein
MGGQNEVTISGLRMHVSNCKVHVHDDSRKMKYERTNGNFKAEVKDAIKQLEDQNGIIKINGDTDTSLYIFKDNKNFNIFLDDNDDKPRRPKVTKENLLDFVKDC